MARVINIDTQYEDLLKFVMQYGSNRPDRTGTGTRSYFGTNLRFDLRRGFPLLTTKLVPLRLVASELLWFLQGESNVKPLQAQGNHIWDEWAKENGELGPIYGVQWRSWPDRDGGKIDQIARLMESLRRDPYSRRHLVTAWNVADLPDMALAPCHGTFQLYVDSGRLSCLMFQRSADMFLGVPFNIASYALLTHMFAQQLDLEAGDLVWVGGDTHIYLNHFEQVRLQLTRRPFPFPTLVMPRRKPASIFDYTVESFSVADYWHHPAIKAPVSV